MNSLIEPISVTEPCGNDYRYEDKFLDLEAEVDKSNSMSEDIATDWSKVYADAASILTTASKDVKVMCWYAYASYKIKSIAGLVNSLENLSQLFLDFGSNLFPKSKKVKISSLLWLEELLEGEFLDERYDLCISLNEKSFLELVHSLQEATQTALGNDIVLFSKLCSALERKIKTAQVDIVPLDTDNLVNETPKRTEEITEIDSEETAMKVYRSLKKNATLLHNYWRKKETADFRSIRLVRMLAWLDIDALPMNESNKTPLHPPSELSLNAIEELIDNEAYTDAFDAIENLIVLSPFWLEGHFIAATTLEKLGSNQAAKEIKNALVSFVKSDEKILDLTFNDNTPFASINMKKWLLDALSSDSTTSKHEEDADETEKIIEEAYKQAKKKQIKEAMGLLQEAYINATDNEGKFRWRLIKAEFAAKYNKNDIALALLEDLKQDIEKYNLLEWKPELAAEVLSLYLNTFNRNTVDVEHLNQAYAHLCKIDIQKALEIKI